MTKSGTINDLQLPEHVRPSSYTLQLKVDVEKQIYDGSVPVSYTHLDVYKRQLTLK